MTSILADDYFIKLIPSANGRLVFKQNKQLDQEDYKLTVPKSRPLILVIQHTDSQIPVNRKTHRSQ
jgi:hypothetical protein